MRKMIIAALALLTIGATLAVTQPVLAGAGKAGGHAGKRIQKLAEKLNLTAAQKAQIKPILKNAAQQVKAVRQNTSLSSESQKAQLKSIRRATMQQIAAILTPAQKQQLAAMRRNHRKNGVGAAG